MHGLDASENGVLADTGNGAAHFVVGAVVALALCLVPGVAVDLLAKAAVVVVAFVVEVKFGPLPFLSVEAMSGGAESDGGAAALVVIDEKIGFFVGEAHEAGVEEEEVGGFESFHAGNGFGAGFDVAVFIDAEKDGAFEAVMLGEDLGDERAGLFGTVFVVVGDEDDVFAFAGAFGAFINKRRGGEEADGGHECEEWF